MRFRVNDDCIGCGLCVSLCPGVFTMADAGTARAIEGEAAQKTLETALEARDGCPVSAIEAEG